MTKRTLLDKLDNRGGSGGDDREWISELEDWSVEFNQSEQKEKKNRPKTKMNRASGTCGIVTKGVTFLSF